MASLSLTLTKPLRNVGLYVLLMVKAFASLGEFRLYRKNLFKQMVRVGIDSIPIVALAAAFSGAVTTVQTAYQLVSPFIPKRIIGSIVAPSLILELGAVVTGFILAGRIGARFAAELGTMRVTEQIDALESLAYDPVAYLVVPRVLAGVVMFPVVVALAIVVGIAAGWLTSLVLLELSTPQFVKGLKLFFLVFDVRFALIKAASFGLVVTGVGAFFGFTCGRGAAGVGVATTRAVVVASMFILVLDAFWAAALL